VPALWPGDAPFINDEPLLILGALRANADGTLAETGLQGTRGVRYGPLPTWLYQGLLLLSHDLVALVSARAVLMMASMAAGLLLLARGLGLWRGYAPVLLLSPYLWFYSRVLWDNPFLLPIGAVGLGAYACFLARREGWALALTLPCLWALPLVHLMALAFVGPIALHLLVFEHRALWRHRWSVLGTLGLGAAAWSAYARYLWGTSGAPPPASNLEGLWFPLLGGRLLSASGLEYLFGPGWEAQGPFPEGLLKAAVLVSQLAFVTTWAGMGLAALRVARALWRRRAEPLDHAAGLGLAIVAAQCVLDWRAGAVLHPHYYNATWPAFALLSWLAVDALCQRWRAARLLPLSQAAALCVVLACLALRIHERGGTRDDRYGPTLGNQVELVRALQRLPRGTRVSTSVENFARFPHGLDALRALEPADPSPGPPVPGGVRLDYAPGDPRSARVVLVTK
jgi:hypothetical protein